MCTHINGVQKPQSLLSAEQMTATVPTDSIYRKKKFNRAYLTALFLASKDNKDLSLHSFMENTSLSLPSSPRPSLWVANDCTLAFAKAVTKTATEPTRDTFLQSIFN